ncbi:MAG: hypothetical protein DRO67_07535, partial [Candidatus Asgardarchaeum californiense]
SKGPDHHYNIKTVENFPKDFKFYRSNVEEMTIGMMITIFNYKNVWVIANNNSIEDVDYSIDVKRTIGNGLGSCWTSIFSKKQDIPITIKDHIYVLDFISKEYNNTWPCSTFELYLLTVIDKKTGKEISPFIVDDISKNLGFARPKHKIITSKRSLSSFMKGVRIPARGVIVSNNDIRIKIPNTLYYSIKSANEAGDHIKPIHIAKIFLACDDDTVLEVIARTFPDYSNYLDLFNKTMDKIWYDLATTWGLTRQFADNTAKFTKAVSVHPLSHLLFMYKNGKIRTFKEGIKKLSAHRLVNITKKKYRAEFKNNIKQLKGEM